MLGGFVEGNRQLIHEEVNFGSLGHERRRHNHGITGLTHHETVGNRGVAAKYGRRRFWREAFTRGFVPHQFHRGEQALNPHLTHDGMIGEFD